MLRLSKIVKDYKVADTFIHALRGVDINFRENEFVSILGPSGCGKTTMLNIVGGLDHATDGDLIINGRSTKEYKDRDWDVYRNHRVGFIFQSYNLIPHQTVLGNVELALTIAGMSKAERTAKAKAALDKVGLSDQYYKRPNQLSGGQCQRVAIARALVNDPEILLADEPTGALDSVTSVQIMELVKEIARERLVIMVTHNPELAEEYSTRIIRLLDGELLSDSNPFDDEAEAEEVALYLQKKAEFETEQEIVARETIKQSGKKHKKKPQKEKAKMSFWTAFKLSLQNLFSKKKRTIMTAIAGSIGIIGVSMVLSISYGIQGYIDAMQNDMLSGNPIEIAQTAMNVNQMMSNMGPSEKKDVLKKIDGMARIDSTVQRLYERAENMSNLMVQNTINKDYVNFVKGIPASDLAALHLDYNLDVAYSLYTDFSVTEAGKKAGESQQTSLTAIRAIYGSILGETQFKDYVSMINMVSASFQQLPNSEEYIRTQYDVSGKFATAEDEIMIVLGSDRNINDLVLAQLGYYSQEEFVNLIYKIPGADGKQDSRYKESLTRGEISFDELKEKEFYWYKNDDLFTAETGFFAGSYTYEPHYGGKDGEVGKGGKKLKVVGILEPKEGLSYGMLDRGFYYTTGFAENVVQANYNSAIVKNLRDNDKDEIMSVVRNGNVLRGNIPSVGQYNAAWFDYKYTYNGVTSDAKGIVGSTNGFSGIIAMIMGGASDDDETLTATLNLQSLGGKVECDVKLDEDGKFVSSKPVLDKNGKAFALPSRIAVYPLDLVHKDAVLKYLDKWDADGDITVYDDFGEAKVLKKADREDVVYSDMMSLIMNMIKSLVDIITVALIGFTSLSLVVSCVMIAIITYVSVVERIKEIGVIRSLGGRKRDVSNLFTAETFIIGATSGIIGITVTWILSAILNAALKGLVGVAIAVFPIHYAVIMLGVSIGLTLISGLMPSQSAAKKDPVVALRSE